MPVNKVADGTELNKLTCLDLGKFVNHHDSYSQP